MRVFIGIELPKDLKEKIYFFSQEIGREYQVKLVEKENLHITFLFLGEISEEEKEKVTRVLGALRPASPKTRLVPRSERAAGRDGGLGGIKLNLGEAKIFPDEKRPYGVWINIEGEKEKLFSLYKKIVDGLLEAGIKLEEKYLRFSPHITIGRFRKTGRDLKGLNLFQDCVDKVQPFSDFLINKVILYQSKLTSKGPLYSKIGEFEVK